jgi:hypothetical protein
MAAMQYPRPGEPIVPRLLRPLVMERRPVTRPDLDTEMLSRFDLGAEVWKRLSPEVCRRLSMLVVDRVQTRVHMLPELTRNCPLPDPGTALTLPIERRTANTIRRGLRMPASAGPWTVERYLGLRRFGGRALVDLLAAVEAHIPAAPVIVEQTPILPIAGDFPSERAFDQALTLITHSLPISEEQAKVELVRAGVVARPVDLGQLARTAVDLGRNAPFHIIDVGGTRMIVRLSDVSTARASYRIAVRAVQGWGTAPIRAVVARLRVVVQAVVEASFVERLLVGIAGFRWLDREDGWFWFAQGRNPLLNDLRKVFSVATRLPFGRLWTALFRTRSGPAASNEAIQQICAAVPGTRIAGGEVTIDRPFDRATHLSEVELRIARLLETTPDGASDAQIRRMAHKVGLPWTPVWRLLRCSPVVERSPNGLYRLLGSTG